MLDSRENWVCITSFFTEVCLSWLLGIFLFFLKKNEEGDEVKDTSIHYLYDQLDKIIVKLLHLATIYIVFHTVISLYTNV
jgi:hypothetical protein